MKKLLFLFAFIFILFPSNVFAKEYSQFYDFYWEDSLQDIQNKTLILEYNKYVPEENAVVYTTYLKDIYYPNVLIECELYLWNNKLYKIQNTIYPVDPTTYDKDKYLYNKFLEIYNTYGIHDIEDSFGRGWKINNTLIILASKNDIIGLAFINDTLNKKAKADGAKINQ